MTYLPIPESPLFNLDLLGESFPQRLFFLLELGVIKLPRSGLAKLPRLHLLRPVCLIVDLFSGVNKIEHMSANKSRAQLLEIAVVFILDFSDAPGVLTALDNTAVGGLDVFLGTDDGERHGSHKGASVLSSGFVILFDRGLVDFDTLSFNHAADAVFEAGEVGRRESVGFGDDGDEVDAGAEALHDFDVEGFEGMAGGADEVEAYVDAEIDLVTAAGLLFLQHVGLVLVVEELDDGHP